MDYLNFENRVTNELTVMFRRAEDPVTKEMARLQTLRTREWCRDYWAAMNREVPVRIRFSKEGRMNKHIELVKRYLAGDEVSIKELQDNSNAANVVAYAAADAASAANAAAAAAAEVCADAAASQADAAIKKAEGSAKHKGRVDYWVKQYERFNKELNK